MTTEFDGDQASGDWEHWSKVLSEQKLSLKNKARRNKFLQNLKQAAEENPVVVLVAVAAVMTAAAKLIKAYGESKGSRAYAKQVEYRIRKGR